MLINIWIFAVRLARLVHSVDCFKDIFRKLYLVAFLWQEFHIFHHLSLSYMYTIALDIVFLVDFIHFILILSALSDFNSFVKHFVTLRKMLYK